MWNWLILKKYRNHMRWISIFTADSKNDDRKEKSSFGNVESKQITPTAYLVYLYHSGCHPENSRVDTLSETDVTTF